MKKCKLADGSPQRVSSRNLRDAEDRDDTIMMLSRCKASRGIADIPKRYCTSSDEEAATKDKTCSDLSPASVGEPIRCNERNRDKENLTGKLCVNSKLRGIQDSRGEHGRMVEDRRRSCHESDGPLRRQENGAPTSLGADNKANNASRLKQKIPRPANAFMLFANEWRKKLAAENPRESNKDISVRLGILWKNMAKDAKEKYFTLAREVDAEHKRKYPDYVYNPKEARLRKAMREQNRELSRRSIIQSAIASANARMGGMGSSSMSVSVAGDFVDHHHHHRFGCVTAAAVSSMPTNVLNPHVQPHGVAEPPWFQAAMHRSKSAHPARPGGPDWYGNVEADPIERLQTMGMMHQRSFDKSGKEAMRNQVASSVAGSSANAAAAECAAAFSTGNYSTDFVARDGEMRRQEADYSPADFSEQKWHPYQNGSSPDTSIRTPHPQPQMPGILQASNQNAPAHAHGHGIWGQFCHGVLPHVPAIPHNVPYRGPRHAVFLRDRPPNRHCGFPEDASRLPYPQSKHDVDNVRSPYPPAEHEAPQMLVPNVDPVHHRDLRDRPKWEHNTGTVLSMDNHQPSTQQDSSQKREKERESARRASEKQEAAKKRQSCRTPLPGFHQAFGSTEIGRFSRSEFFVNMVGETGAGGSSDDSMTLNAGANVVERSDVSRSRTLDAGESVESNSTAINSAAAATAASVANMTASSRTYEADEADPTSGYGEHRNETLVGDAGTPLGTPLGTPVGNYCGQPSAPRWHSPHVGAVGSEI